jgi:hypothetical protein
MLSYYQHRERYDMAWYMVHDWRLFGLLIYRRWELIRT